MEYEGGNSVEDGIAVEYGGGSLGKEDMVSVSLVCSQCTELNGWMERRFLMSTSDKENKE